MFYSTDYRVWDKQEKKMWTKLPDSIIDRSPFKVMQEIGYKYVALQDGEVVVHTVMYGDEQEGEETSEIMRYAEVNHFIGVRDRQGNKVYEGDLVASNATLEAYQVIYNVKTCAFMLMSRTGDMVYINAEQFQKHCTVIGNIYEEGV